MLSGVYSGLDDRDVTPDPLHPLYTTDIMSKDDEVGSAFGHTAATHSFLCRRLRDHRCDYTFLPLKKAEEIESFPSLPKGHAYSDRLSVKVPLSLLRNVLSGGVSCGPRCKCCCDRV